MARSLLSPSLRPVALSLAVAAAVTLTACSSNSTDETDLPATTTAKSRSGSSVAASTETAQAPASTAASSSPSTQPTSATTNPAAELKVAVRAFWDLYLQVGGSTGPFDAEATRTRLASRTTGASLNRLMAYFSSNAASGYVVRGTIDVAPTVVQADGSNAQVRDCYDDTTGLYRVADGSRVDTDNPLRHQVLMTFVRDGGVWKVSAITDEGDGCTA